MGGGKKKKNRKRSSKGEDKLPIQKQENVETSKFVAESDAAFLDVSGASADLSIIEDQQTDLSTEKSTHTLSDDDCYNKKRSSSGGRKKANSAVENAGDDVNEDTIWSKRKPNDVSTKKISDDENENHFYSKKRSGSGGRMKDFGAERSRDRFLGQGKTDFSAEKSKNVENKDVWSKRKPRSDTNDVSTKKISDDENEDHFYNKKRSSSGGRMKNFGAERSRDSFCGRGKTDFSTEKPKNVENKDDTRSNRKSGSGNRYSGSPYRTQSLERYVRRYLREETDNPEFETFKKEICLDYGTSIVEKDVNLFEMPEDYSLGHCVAEDFNMGAGIAVQFRLKFRRVDELLQNHQKTGGLAVLNDKQRFIYYMVSKQFSHGKPTYYTLFLCLQKMAEHVEKHDVKHLAMPRIGCGLDKLDWKTVKKMIEFIFRDSDIEIVICDYQPPEDSTPQRLRNCKTVNVTYPIENIESGTIILFLLTQSHFVSEEMKALNKKFRIEEDYKNFRGGLGEVFYTERRNLNYNLCGCVVRQTEKDLIDFVALRKCLSEMQKKTKESDIGYVGFQAIKDDDPCTNHKIINLLKNTLRGFEVYVCWPGELEKLMPLSNREQSSSSQNDSSAKDSTKGPSSFFSKKDGGGSWRSNKI